VEEMDAQLKGGNFSLILRSKVPKGATILPAVWQMKRKRRIQLRKSTSGRLASTLMDLAKSKGTIIGTHMHQLRHGVPFV